MNAPMSRAELLRKYSGLSRDIHTVSPMVEQIEAAMQGDKPVYKSVSRKRDPVLVGHSTYSPGARFHPRLSEALDFAKEIRTTVPDSRWLEENARIDYIHSNLPARKRLDYDPDGHSLNVIGMDHASRVEDYRLGLDVGVTGPVGVRCVVLVDPLAPTYAPKLPWSMTEGEEASPSVVAFPVPFGYSTERIARQVMHYFASQCHWCGCRGIPFGVLVSAGSTTYLFPVCGTCWWEYTNDVHGGCEISLVGNDGEDFGTGWPADEHR
jgi:hypothetical protein